MLRMLLPSGAISRETIGLLAAPRNIIKRDFPLLPKVALLHLMQSGEEKKEREDQAEIVSHSRKPDLFPEGNREEARPLMRDGGGPERDIKKDSCRA